MAVITPKGPDVAKPVGGEPPIVARRDADGLRQRGVTHPAIVVTNATGLIISYDDEAEHLYGWRPDEVLGQLAKDVLVFPADLEIAGQIMASVMIGETWEGSFSHRGKGDRFVDVFTRNTPIVWEGRVVAVVGTSVPMPRAALPSFEESETTPNFAMGWTADAWQLIGELDNVTAPCAEDAIKQIVQGQVGTVTLDLSRLTFCDCSGLSVFIMAKNSLDESGGRLVLRSPSPLLVKILDITGLRPTFICE